VVEPTARIDFGRDTLSTLGRQTEGASTELGDLVRQIAATADDLGTSFSGPGRKAFDELKGRADEVAKELDTALARILTGVTELDTEYTTGMERMGDEVRSKQANADLGKKFRGAPSEQTKKRGHSRCLRTVMRTTFRRPPRSTVR
jgi:methyl-accepting chemotaxis protein